MRHASPCPPAGRKKPLEAPPAHKKSGVAPACMVRPIARRPSPSFGIIRSASRRPSPIPSLAFRRFLLKPVEDQFIAVHSVMETSFHPGNGCRAGTRFNLDLIVGVAFPEHAGHLQSLGESLDLPDGAQVVKKLIALVDGLQAQDRPKQLVQLPFVDFIQRHPSSLLPDEGLVCPIKTFRPDPSKFLPAERERPSPREFPGGNFRLAGLARLPPGNRRLSVPKPRSAVRDLPVLDRKSTRLNSSHVKI